MSLLPYQSMLVSHGISSSSVFYANYSCSSNASSSRHKLVATQPVTCRRSPSLLLSSSSTSTLFRSTPLRNMFNVWLHACAVAVSLLLQLPVMAVLLSSAVAACVCVCVSPLPRGRGDWQCYSESKCMHHAGPACMSA